MGPSSISTVAGTRGGSGATVYEFSHIQQGFVWRDNHFKGFVSNCTSLTRFCTNGAITSFTFADRTHICSFLLFFIYLSYIAHDGPINSYEQVKARLNKIKNTINFNGAKGTQVRKNRNSMLRDVPCTELPHYQTCVLRSRVPLRTDAVLVAID
jgi:hypothetical protein